MKVAIIGSGFIANTHAQELIRLGMQPSCVIGKNEKRTEDFARRWGIPSFSTDLSAALADDIDAVHVCTPPTLHYDEVKALIEAGKHVICEKHLCLTASEAKELAEAARDKGVVAAVNFNVRYHPMCSLFRDRVASGEAGPVLLISGSYEQEFHIMPTEYSWRYDEALAGKMRAATEIGSHWIDLARFITGLEITAVSATFGSFFPDRIVKDGLMYPAEDAASNEEQGSGRAISVASEDAVSATLRLSNGAMANLYLSEITHGRSNRLGIEVTGTLKTLRWNSEDPYTLESAGHFTGTTRDTQAFGGGFPDTFSSLFRDVYADIKQGRPSEAPAYPTFFDGYRCAAVCEALGESASKGSAWTEVR